MIYLALLAGDFGDFGADSTLALVSTASGDFGVVNLGDGAARSLLALGDFKSPVGFGDLAAATAVAASLVLTEIGDLGDLAALDDFGDKVSNFFSLI